MAPQIEKIILYVTFLFSSVLVPTAFAIPQYPQDTTIYFGNGIWTSPGAADLNLLGLEDRILVAVSGTRLESTLAFKVAYNKNEGVLRDLAEALKQDLETNNGNFWNWLGRVDLLPNSIQKKIQEISSRVDAAVLADNPEVQTHVEFYNKALSECRRVVVVAHSQGNYYANVAYAGIEPTLIDGFGIVSVANPDSKVEGGERFPGITHTTLYEDLVINVIPGAMNANVRNYFGDSEALYTQADNDYQPTVEVAYSPIHGHSFVENYLDKDTKAETKIVNDTVAMVTELLEFDNIDFCGWPAVYGDNVSVIREPYDRDASENGESLIWDTVWTAANSNKLVVEYRLGSSGTWQKLNQHTAWPDSVYYHAGAAGSDSTQKAPFVFVNDTFGFGQTIEVQPDDVDAGVPMGIQQFRLVINDEVIDQFTVDYDQEPWIEVRTSRPISDTLFSGSSPVMPVL